MLDKQQLVMISRSLGCRAPIKKIVCFEMAGRKTNWKKAGCKEKMQKYLLWPIFKTPYAFFSSSVQAQTTFECSPALANLLATRNFLLWRVFKKPQTVWNNGLTFILLPPFCQSSKLALVGERLLLVRGTCGSSASVFKSQLWSGTRSFVVPIIR